MGRPNKAGVCPCGHEIRYWHDPETGQCMAGRAWKGHAANPHGACTCVRKVKGKTMNGATRTKATTRTVTVDGDKVLGALDQIIEGLQTIRAEVARGKETRHAKTFPDGSRLLVEPPPTSKRAEAPARAASVVDAPDGEGLSSSELSTLYAIAQWGGCTTNDVLVIATGRAERTVQNHLAALSAGGLIERNGGVATLTEEGRARAAGADPKPTRADLLRRWLLDLPAQRAVLEAIAKHGSRSTAQLVEELPHLAERTIQNHLAELARWNLVDRQGGVAWLHPELGGPA